MFNLKTTLAATVLAGAATVAIAEATDPNVIARQEAMKTIGGNMKSLSQMMKGEKPFDSAAAQAAVATISETAGQVPALFEVEAQDPESDAADEIWFLWDEFVEKAEALKAAADGHSGIDSPEALGAAMGALGGTCKACHDQFKL